MVDKDIINAILRQYGANGLSAAGLDNRPGGPPRRTLPLAPENPPGTGTPPDRSYERGGASSFAHKCPVCGAVHNPPTGWKPEGFV